MKALVHFKTPGFIDLSREEHKIEFLSQFMMETNMDLIEVVEYPGEIDNQVDTPNLSDERSISIDLVIDLPQTTVENFKEHETFFKSVFSQNLAEAPPALIQEWECGNDQCFLIEMAAGNPPVQIDWDF